MKILAVILAAQAAYSELQDGVMDGIATAAANAILCKHSTLNTKLAAEMMVVSGLGDEEAKREFHRRVDKIVSTAMPLSTFACSKGIEAFGPNGTMAKNLLIPK
ncbi:hypothetical protein LAC81_07695 [Ensifer adhaerens]|uniref:hypothetical protein n=1 Tax=Ensifer adhaerens TaxID=106592 RepID=UPI001CBC0A93|nr:hypothetical protein [Ensifer adhaerens]MBZ7921663.1 hypothetical protein [Ensifer adhaerens]UAX94078.1 hypothetical protein LAC78_07690 [Ensifer adhaerens]UAY01712.1 hypothetical protein LAC80_07695 [Ensifer adhaerens]UAY09096.1 hypothetical protein LAC81_07695 [Ensifer adhaerens]